jgi:hypothetical protein
LINRFRSNFFSRGQVDINKIYFAGKSEWNIVVIEQWRAEIYANIHRFIQRKSGRSSTIDLSGSSYFVININRAGTSFSDSTAKNNGGKVGGGGMATGLGNALNVAHVSTEVFY